MSDLEVGEIASTCFLAIRVTPEEGSESIFVEPTAEEVVVDYTGGEATFYAVVDENMVALKQLGLVNDDGTTNQAASHHKLEIATQNDRPDKDPNEPLKYVMYDVTVRPEPLTLGVNEPDAVLAKIKVECDGSYGFE